MIRMLQPQDTGRVMQLWLEGNLDAHAFVPGNYWCEKVSMVRELLLQAEVYVYEQNGEIQGFVGLQGDMIAGIFVDRLHRSGGIGKQLLNHVKHLHPVLLLSVYRKNYVI